MSKTSAEGKARIIGRRSLLAMLGLGPVAASAGSFESSAPSYTTAQVWMGEPVRSATSSLSANKIVRLALKAGVISEDEARRIVAEEFASNGHYEVVDPSLKSYRSFSETAKLRIQRETWRRREFDRFINAPDKGPFSVIRDKLDALLGSEATHD